MEDDFCPKCGRKTFHYSYCEKKLRCSSCRYFLLEKEFEEIKEKAKQEKE